MAFRSLTLPPTRLLFILQVFTARQTHASIKGTCLRVGTFKPINSPGALNQSQQHRGAGVTGALRVAWGASPNRRTCAQSSRVISARSRLPPPLPAAAGWAGHGAVPPARGHPRRGPPGATGPGAARNGSTSPTVTADTGPRHSHGPHSAVSPAVTAGSFLSLAGDPCLPLCCGEGLCKPFDQGHLLEGTPPPAGHGPVDT